MHHIRGRVAPTVLLLSLAVVLAGCGSDTKTSPQTESERDCAGVTAAAHQIVLQNPKTITDADIDRINAAADQLMGAADNATTAVADPAHQLPETAKSYADALAAKNVGRATILEARLRQQAVPVAQKCGLGE